jgi:hypothetical protein
MLAEAGDHGTSAEACAALAYVLGGLAARARVKPLDGYFPPSGHDATERLH